MVTVLGVLGSHDACRGDYYGFHLGKNLYNHGIPSSSGSLRKSLSFFEVCMNILRNSELETFTTLLFVKHINDLINCVRAAVCHIFTFARAPTNYLKVVSVQPRDSCHSRWTETTDNRDPATEASP